MEGKLVKTTSTYHLVVNDKIIASKGDSDGKLQKLSLKNCEVIANGYDLDELAKEEYKYNPWSVNEMSFRLGFDRGFQKALEILGDKKFSEEDMKNAIYIAWDDDNLASTDIIQSLQQTEWNVEIVMECVIGCENLIINGENSLCCGNKKPKLDTDGCLILKIK